jgi:2-polyprenyl-3-methyl-5-hydroxy-6-metoxy-1,4-benzoquinol methylase
VLEWYTKVKLRLEKNYQLIMGNVPGHGKILDLGCGYGVISHMLALTAPGREITGVDYDEEKIRVASHGFLNSPRLNFKAADIRSFEFSPQDCIILSDVLHYLPPHDQEKLLLKCMQSLNPGGGIIIRDADSNREKGHSRSRFTEFLSIGMGFNKTFDKNLGLHFISTGEIERIAKAAGFMMKILDSKTYSSNTYYSLKKNKEA